ncbi:hypothetical protein EDD11_008272 [Mortierella claussenii]|nr:hypothetical protein EDD11_008272 [Mortierella claussenii]
MQKGIRKRPPSFSPTSSLFPKPVKSSLSALDTSGSSAEEKRGDENAVEEEQVNKNSDQIDNSKEDDEQGRTKKQRLEGPHVEEGMSQLSIASNLSSGAPSPAKPQPLASSSAVKLEEEARTKAPEGGSDQIIKEFNRNTEQMIEVYFKEGMDASGVEMFDILLGPFRRPTKEFVAAFFYAVVLSPLTEPATIEAAIHVLDRILTIHGPEPFQNIWDVQKRRREFADGTSAFSRQSSSPESSSSSPSGSGLSSGMSTRSSANAGSDPIASATRALTVPTPTDRLPSWNSIWDLIKAEFGLDSRPESKQHIALQEYHIRMRLQGHIVFQDSKTAEDDEDIVQGVREEQEIRDEIGRDIVGLLLRVLEQDAVLNNVSMTTYFCRDVLMIDPFSPSQTVRQVLDIAFQIISLATSSRYLGPPTALPLSSHSSCGRTIETTTTASGGVTTTTKTTARWPVNERCILNSAGMEILQLGQQFLLLLIRFTEAGVLLPNKGLEELAREVLSRLGKVNKDRKLTYAGLWSAASAPSTSSSSLSTSLSTSAAGSSRASTSPKSAIPFLLERYNLDQTEIFLKTLIQGPCLLDSGTGSGAGVKLRRERTRTQSSSQGLEDGLPTSGSGGGDDSFSSGGDDCNDIFKSQTGICMGSSTFVMILVDLWFRSKTTSSVYVSSSNSQLSFRRVVEEYAMPNDVRPASATPTTTVAAAATTSSTSKTDKNKKSDVATRASSRRRRASVGLEEEGEYQNIDGARHDKERLSLASVEDPSATLATSAAVDDQDCTVEQWNAKDLEQVEWTVMMIEVLVWSWIEARGIRRDEIEGTGLEQVLYQEEGSSQRSNRQDHGASSSSGWLAMSKLLETIGGSLRFRWEQLESIIEAAIMVEDLCLR